MKKILTGIVVVFITSAAYAQFQEKDLKKVDLVKVSKSEVPGELEKKVQQDFTDVGPVEFFTAADTTVTKNWEISEEINFDEGEEIEYYHVEMRGKNSYYEALYDSNSKLIMSKELQKDVAIPMEIRKAYATSEYKNIPIVKDKHYKVTHHGHNKEYYQLTLANGDKVTYNSDGTFAKN